MANLIDNASFTANEVYEIQATDPVEGAASGASFGGIGLSNQPHQQLANRTAFLKQRQDTNIANIGALQSFTGLFRGMMGPNGYVKIPFQDVNRGLITVIVQWGFAAYGLTLGADAPLNVTWPTAFPSVCEFALATLARPGSTADNATDVGVQVVSLSASGGVFELDVFNKGSAVVPGFYWLAIGF